MTMNKGKVRDNENLKYKKILFCKVIKQMCIKKDSLYAEHLKQKTAGQLKKILGGKTI